MVDSRWMGGILRRAERKEGSKEEVMWVLRWGEIKLVSYLATSRMDE